MSINQSLSFSCHSEPVSESHPIYHFEISRNLLSLFFVKKTNEKRLVFDFRRSKLVSAIQCFKSFATQTVKHFNHAPQLFDTRLQIIWHFYDPFSIFKYIIHFTNLKSQFSHLKSILFLNLSLNLKYILLFTFYKSHI